jgi:hypothetical protein
MSFTSKVWFSVLLCCCKLADGGLLPQYEVVKLQPPQGNRSYVTAVNNSGISVGYDVGVTGTDTAIRWDISGTPTILTPQSSSYSRGQARDIDDAGSVLVSVSQSRMYLFTKPATSGSPTFLFDFPGGDEESVIDGSLSNNRTVVMHSANGPGYYWDATTGLQLYSGVDGKEVSKDGEIVGTVYENPMRHAAHLNKSSLDYKYSVPQDINTTATHINRHGDVLGYVGTSALRSSGFVFDSTGYHDLINNSSLPHTAGNFIDDNGLIYGDFHSDDRTILKAIVWKDYQPYDFDQFVATSGWTIKTIADVSDTGYIVAYGTSGSSSVVPILLRPVPEPVTGLALILAFLSVRLRVTCPPR